MYDRGDTLQIAIGHEMSCRVLDLNGLSLSVSVQNERDTDDTEKYMTEEGVDDVRTFVYSQCGTRSSCILCNMYADR